MRPYNLLTKFGILLVITFTSALGACQPTRPSTRNITNNTKNTTTNNTTNTATNQEAEKYDKKPAYPQTNREKLMLREINMVRANPKAYVEFVEAYLKNEERGLAIPRTPTITTSSRTSGGKTVTTRDTAWSGGGFDKSRINKNAVAAAKQLITELQKMKPVSMLTPSACLTKAAKEQGDYCKSTGKMSHSGKNGKQIHERLPKFCSNLASGSENLCAGSATVREAFLQLLVDGNVPDRGHRKNLLNPEHTLVGVYETGSFNGFVTGWVQEFGH